MSSSSPLYKTSVPRLSTLPSDVLHHIISYMPLSAAANLSETCRSLHTYLKPILHRTFLCTLCYAPLFPARMLLSAPSKRHRTPFLGTRLLSTQEKQDDVNVVLSKTYAEPNFEVLRELHRGASQPLDVAHTAVHVLRCAKCGAYIGFRRAKDDDAEEEAVDTEKDVHAHAHDLVAYVHYAYVEMDVEKNVNSDVCLRRDDRCVQEKGDAWMRCSKEGCTNLLFTEEDLMPWTHVLASTRLTDFDAMLEWDHAWAGVETAAQPALFVRRMRENAVKIGNQRQERLRQGVMIVADVRCASCLAFVGWKFLKEVHANGDAKERNYDQIGRFAAVRGAFESAKPLQRHAPAEVA